MPVTIIISIIKKVLFNKNLLLAVAVTALIGYFAILQVRLNNLRDDVAEKVEQIQQLDADLERVKISVNYCNKVSKIKIPPMKPEQFVGDYNAQIIDFNRITD